MQGQAVCLWCVCSLNYERYQSWCQQAGKPAGYAFDGPAYKALNLRSLQDADVQFAQQHVRILDALYGLLKPLGTIKPYRLEMSSKLQTQRGKTLYAFWGNTLVDALNRQVLHIPRSQTVLIMSDTCCAYYVHYRELTDCAPEAQFLVNCASQVSLSLRQGCSCQRAS